MLFLSLFSTPSLLLLWLNASQQGGGGGRRGGVGGRDYGVEEVVEENIVLCSSWLKHSLYYVKALAGEGRRG